MTKLRFLTGLLIGLILAGSFVVAQDFEQVNTTSPQSLSSKTLVSPILSGTVTGAYTLGGTPTITGATLTSPLINTPTITSPTFSGTAIGTYTLAGTPTFTAPTISNPVFSGSATGTYTLAGSPTIVSPVLSGTLTGTYTVGGTPTVTSPTITTPSVTGGTYSGGTFTTPVLSGSVTGTYNLSGTPTLTAPILSGTLTGTYILGGTLGVSLFDTKGDFLAASANDTPAKLSVGANGTVLMARSTATTGLAYVTALTKAISGCTYANSAGDVTNDLDLSTCNAMDATGAYWMTVASSMTKQSDVLWAVGSGVGGLDTGVVGNNDYYIWEIARSDTGVTDYLFSLSSTAPTMPANYDFKRLIGWFKRVGGSIVAFHTYETEGGGLEFNWDVPTLDVSLTNTLTTTRRTDAVKVPLNFSVLAHLHVQIIDGGSQGYAWVYNPDLPDTAPSLTVAPLLNMVASGGANLVNQMHIRTSAAGLIAARSPVGIVDTYSVVTLGFTWARRN